MLMQHALGIVVYAESDAIYLELRRVALLS